MSCGQISLKELGIDVECYYASEIEQKSIEVTQSNFPNTIQLGDVKLLEDSMLKELPKIDLILSGFPCRDVSICTRQGGSKNWEKMHEKGKGLEGEHSGLYYEFLRIYKFLKSKNPNIKFLVENVDSMKDDEKQVINDDLEVKGTMIDSAWFSAQERKRIYWTNITSNRTLTASPQTIKDIIEDEERINKKYYEKRDWVVNGDGTKRIFGRLVFPFNAHDMSRRIYNIDYKAPTLTACRGGNLQKKIIVNGKVRKVTPLEYRRLQTIPEWYKMDVADSHIYNMCGDGWTIAVIKHILSGLKIDI